MLHIKAFYRFAEELNDLNLSQSILIKNIRTFLQQNNRRPALIKQFEKGYCCGIATVWLYAKWLQTQKITSDKPRDDYTWFKAITQLIAKWSGQLKDLTKTEIFEIDQFIAKIQFFQRTIFEPAMSASPRIGFAELQQSLIDTKNNTLTKEYTIGSLLTLEQLKLLLATENLIQDSKLILVASHNHGTALFKQGDTYYYFNANCKTGELETKSIDELAQWIFQAILFLEIKQEPPLSIPMPLTLRIFSFPGTPTAPYPSLQKVLESINPMFEHFDPKIRSYAAEQSSLMTAVRSNSLASLQYFLNRVDFTEYANQHACNYTPLLTTAAENGNLDIIEAILAKMIEFHHPNFITNIQITLNRAAEYGHLGIVKALVNKLPEGDQALNEDGYTALMLAAHHGNLSVVQELIEHKAAINYTTKDNYTALIMAAQTGRSDVVHELIKYEVDVDCISSDSYNYTALMFAARYNHFSIAQELASKVTNIEQANNMGYTALIIAAAYGNLSVMQELIKHQADINQVALNGSTAIMFAAQADHLKIVQELINLAVDINQVNKQGKTALMFAAEQGNDSIVWELMIAGADLTKIESITHKTAAELAQIKGCTKTAQILQGATAQFIQLLRSQPEGYAVPHTNAMLLIAAIKANNIMVIKELLKRNPDLILKLLATTNSTQFLPFLTQTITVLTVIQAIDFLVNNYSLCKQDPETLLSLSNSLRNIVKIKQLITKNQEDSVLSECLRVLEKIGALMLEKSSDDPAKRDFLITSLVKIVAAVTSTTNSPVILQRAILVLNQLSINEIMPYFTSHVIAQAIQLITNRLPVMMTGSIVKSAAARIL